MTPDKTDFSHPATKVAGCMAVTGSSPGVYPSNVAVLALESFRKEFPLLADRLESMPQRGGDCVAGSLRDGSEGGGAPVPEFVTPPSNTGVNKIFALARGSK